MSNARKYLVSCAVGLSGAVFGLIVIDTAFSNVQSRSIFGLFMVPAQWYPWALLLFWQLLMPGVSFLGHLGGVLAGQAYVWGWFKWAIPSAARFQVGRSTCSSWIAVSLPPEICALEMYDVAMSAYYSCPISPVKERSAFLVWTIYPCRHSLFSLSM